MTVANHAACSDRSDHIDILDQVQAVAVQWRRCNEYPAQRAPSDIGRHVAPSNCELPAIVSLTKKGKWMLTCKRDNQTIN